jgi:predicted ATPase
MSMNQRDQARRFITLVDELYNARCLLVCSAALPPDQLFAGTSGEEPILDLEGLQFEGAVEGGLWLGCACVGCNNCCNLCCSSYHKRQQDVLF